MFISYPLNAGGMFFYRRGCLWISAALQYVALWASEKILIIYGCFMEEMMVLYSERVACVILIGR